MNRSFILSPAAEADLRGLIRYSRKQWGTTQTATYVTNLKRGITALAQGKGFIKDMNDIYPQLCMARCQHHYVFCVSQDKAPAIVVAILHERMDLMNRLKNRLSLATE